ncbi:MAG: serine dehydratase subunit alpha family protein [Fervidobacterium sp.]
MNRKTKEKIKQIFFDNVKLSYGCTEPVAVGLSVAVGKKYLKGPIKLIEVIMDRNTYKNGLEVGIPGTHLHGFDLAIALAYLVGNAELGLEVFKNVKHNHIEDALKMKELIKVSYKNDSRLHIQTRLVGENEVTVEITDSHDNISRIVVDKAEIYNNQTTVLFKKEIVKSINLDDIFNYIQEPDEEVLNVVEEAIKYNLKAAEEGIKVDGNFGNTFFTSDLTFIVPSDNYKSSKDCNELKNLNSTGEVERYIKSYVASGVDLRMNGALIPIMTVAGSGNQGISCTLPPLIFGLKMSSSEDKIMKGVLLSILVTIYIKAYTGTLTPICGAGSIASAGSTAGISYLMGADHEQIKNAINNLLSTLFGMICDGAKRGCSLKASIGAQMAINAALLALRNTNIPCGNGFAAKNVETTIRRIELLTNSLRQFDQDVIEFIGHC